MARCAGEDEMKCSKTVLNILVVLMVLSFTFTTVEAQAPVDQWEQQPPEIFEFSVDATIPYPIAPASSNAYVFTKTPKFYFSQVPGAVSYQIKVVDAFDPGDIIYYYKGPGTCNNGYCWLQPDTPLKPLDLTLENGFYIWNVCAKFDTWGDWSSSGGFSVFSTGFNSSFNTGTKKWQQVTGNWTRVDPGYYKTKGILGKFSSVTQKEIFINNMVFEVRLKRKTETGTNSIIILGSPGNLDSNNYWKNGYYLTYNNAGYWSFGIRKDGVLDTLIPATISPFIKPYDWNTITVWRQEPYIRMWINGAYVGYVVDDQRSEGCSGVGMWENLPDVSPLLVDSAKMYYSTFSPYTIPEDVLIEEFAGRGLE